MSIDLTNGFDELLAHVDHGVRVVSYGPVLGEIVNVAIECETCGTVLLDFDRDPEETPVSEALGVALHTLAKYREIGKRNPNHYQSVGLQYAHIVALLDALGYPEATAED